MSSLRPSGWRGLVSAAILSAAALGVAACGGSGDDNAGATNRQENTQQSSQSGTQSDSTNQSSSTQSGGGSMSQSSFSTDEGIVRLYAGSSDAKIDLDVDGDSRLLWSNDKGSSFRLTGAGSPIDSRDGSGEVSLSGGQHHLEVHGDVWTIVIRPG
jgi:hypothetical protein